MVIWHSETGRRIALSRNFHKKIRASGRDQEKS
jgi:hypothetical protein